jgi:hypothetical protein
MRGAREPATSLPSGVACRAIDSHPPAHLLGRCDQAMSRWAHTRHRRRAAAASRTHHAESDFGAVTRDHTFDVLGSLPRDRFFKSPKIDTHLVATAARQRACPRRPPRKKNHATMLKSTRDFGMFDAYKTALERASSLASRV